MDIKDIVKSFNTTPFLFVGSGISRRYINLPDWEGLLKYFVTRINDDDFAYDSYVNKAKTQEPKEGLLPKVAELIQKDFDEKWFNTPSLRMLNSDELSQVHKNISPFKVELSHYITSTSTINDKYADEIALLKRIAPKSISGVITTNYDSFLEDHLPDFTKYIGQRELIFSPLQGIAEIYKIHGSIGDPNSIVINEKDYIEFNSKSSYLAAKLMTIFLEYPIIFIGYSISDTNIKKIIHSIINCLDSKQLSRLENRFIFIEYIRGKSGLEIAPFTIVIEKFSLTMTKIQLSDFSLLYSALDGKKSEIPVKFLRRFKQDLYNYTLTNTPTSNLRVAALDDTRIGDEELVMAIGTRKGLGLKGLSGITPNEWFRDIILNDLNASADDLLEHVLPSILKQGRTRIPISKYIANAKKTFPSYEKMAQQQNFDSFICNSIKSNRELVKKYTSIKQIWDTEQSSIERATRLIAHLPEKYFNVNELERVLLDIFHRDKNILESNSPNIGTNIRRLIRIYDYLKWNTKKSH